MAAGYIPDRELFEMIRRVVRQYANSFQPRPKRPKHVRRFAGGSSTENFTQFAHVVEEATADGGLGACVLLNDDMEALGEDGEPLVLDPDDPEYDEALIDGLKTEFKCAQVHAPCPVGARVWLSSNDQIKPGGLFEDHKVWGVCVDVVDYLYALTGAGAETSLVIPTAGDGPEDIKWQGGEC
jgi:hypothetical protein